MTQHETPATMMPDRATSAATTGMSDPPTSAGAAAPATPPGGTPPKKSLLRRVIRAAVLGFLVVVLILGLGIAWVTQTGHGRKFLLAQVSDILSESVFTGTMTARRIDGPIFGEFILRDLTLTDDEGREVAFFNEAYVRYTFVQLVRKRLIITRLTIDGMRVAGRIREDGSLNLANLFIPGDPDKVPPEQGFAVAIQQLTLNGTDIRIIDERVNELVVAFTNPTLIADFDMDGRGRMHAGVKQLASDISFGLALGKEFSSRIDDLAIDIDPDRITFAAERLSVGETGLFGFDGSIERSPEGDEDPFKYLEARMPQLVFSPDEMLAFVPSLPLATTLSVGATIAGPPEDVALRAALSGADQDATLRVKLDLSKADDLGLIGELLVAQFKPELWLALSGMTGDVNAAIRFKVQGLTPQRLVAGLEVDIEPSTLLGYKLDRGLLRLGYAQNVATIDAMYFNAGSAVLSGEGRVALSGDVDLHIGLEAPDLSDLTESAPNAPELRGRANFSMSAVGQVPFEALQGADLDTVPDILHNVVRFLDIRAVASTRNFAMPGVRIRAADVELKGIRGDAFAATLDAQLDQASFSGTDVESFRANAHVRGDQLALNAHARTMGADLLVDTAGAWSMQGVNLRVNQLDVDYRSIRGGLAYPARIEAHLSDDGAFQGARVQDFNFEGPGVLVRLDQARYDASGALSADYQIRAEQVKDLADVLGLADWKASGALSASGQVEGSVSRPRYVVDLQTRDVRAMNFGPVTGSLRAEQLAQYLSLDGALCLGAVTDNTTLNDPTCAGREVLLLADDVRLPIVPGFTSVGPRFDEKGELQGAMVIGPIEIAGVAAELPQAQPYTPRGVVGVQLYLDGTFIAPNVAAIATLKNVYATVPASQNAPAVEVGPISTVANLKIEDAGEGLAQASWGLGGAGLKVGYDTWLRARGDVRGPVRGFLLGKIPLRELVQNTWGTLISLEVPDRPFRDLPTALLPKELGRDGSLYMSLDVTREEAFSGAKFWANVSNFTWEDIGPLEIFASAVSSNDTVLNVSVESQSVDVGATLDANLHVSLPQLLMRGIDPKDALQARLYVPMFSLQDLPSGAVRDRVASITQKGVSALSPKISGYLDVFNTLGDLQARGRFHVGDIMTATGGITEAALEVLLGDTTLTHMSGADPRLQVMMSVCGPNDVCALQLHAGAKVPVRSGDFIFGDEKARDAAIARVMRAEYAGRLFAENAPLAALAPAWLLTDIATNVDGSLAADLTVNGRLDSLPAIRGELHVHNGQGEILPLARRIEDLDVSLLFGPRTVRLDRLFVDDGRGTIVAQGDVDLVNGLPSHAALQFDFDRFLLADPSGLGVFLSASVPVTATINDDLIAVDVRLDNADVVVPDSATSGSSSGPAVLPENVIFLGEGQSLAQYVDEEERRALVGEGDGSRPKVSLPIRVHAYSREDVRVKHRFADLNLGVDMTLKMEGDDIKTSGGVEVSTGFAQVFGKRFDIAQGRVLFDGSGDGPFDPRVRLTATHRLPRKTAAQLSAPSGQFASVSVLMDTYVSQLKIELRSDPPMTESDILNVLLTGRPLDAESDAKPEALTTAGSLLAGFLTDQLGANPVLDNISVELDDSDGTLDSRFEGGRYFGKDNSIYASVAYIAGADVNQNSVEVAWQFILAQLRNSSVRLELRWGNRRTGAVELLYDLRLEKGLRFVR